MENTKTESEQTEGMRPPPWVGALPFVMPDGSERHLVLLADVVRLWLMRTKRFAGAAMALHKALNGCEGLELLLAYSETGKARPLCSEDTFFLPSRPTYHGNDSFRAPTVTYADGTPVSAVRHVDPPRLPQVPPQLPEGWTDSQSAALRYIETDWCSGNESILDFDEYFWPGDTRRAARRLAMPCEQAAALWGAKPVPSLATQKSTFPLADFEDLVAYRNANKGKLWIVGNQLELARAEVEKQGGNTKAYDVVAKRLSMKRQSLESTLKQDRPQKPLPAGGTFPSADQLNKSRAG